MRTVTLAIKGTGSRDTGHHLFPLKGLSHLIQSCFSYRSCMSKDSARFTGQAGHLKKKYCVTCKKSTLKVLINFGFVTSFDDVKHHCRHGFRTESRMIKGKRTLSKGAVSQKSKVKSPKSRRVKGRHGKKSTVKKDERDKSELTISQNFKKPTVKK